MLFVLNASQKPYKCCEQKVFQHWVATAQTVQVVTTHLEAGMQSYSVNTADLPNGYYVIRVQENEKLHTRIVVKQ